MKRPFFFLFITALVLTSGLNQGTSRGSSRPLIVIGQAKIRYSGWGFLSDNGYVIPNQGYKLLVVFMFIQQLSATEKVSKSGLDRSLKDSKGLTLKPIRFGFPTVTETIDMVGQLESGELSNFVDGKEPLLGIVFVVDSRALELLFLDSKGEQFRITVKKDFRPSKENVVTGFNCSGSIRARIKGENWSIGPYHNEADVFCW